MHRVQCPQCGERIGLGICTDPGACPRCEAPMMHTSEFRALSDEELRAEIKRRCAQAERATLR